MPASLLLVWGMTTLKARADSPTLPKPECLCSNGTAGYAAVFPRASWNVAARLLMCKATGSRVTISGTCTAPSDCKDLGLQAQGSWTPFEGSKDIYVQGIGGTMDSVSLIGNDGGC